jgi:hypothetical protein
VKWEQWGKTKFGHIRSQVIRRHWNVQMKGNMEERRRNEEVPRMAPERIVRTIGDISPRRRSSLEDRVKDEVTYCKR